MSFVVVVVVLDIELSGVVVVVVSVVEVFEASLVDEPPWQAATPKAAAAAPASISLRIEVIVLVP